MQEYTMREFVKRFTAKEFDAPDLETQCKAGWYDWFCRDTSLANKTKRLGNIVRHIVNSTKFDADKVYVFFKNNCPMVGHLYDSFSICDLESGDVLFWITPSNGHKSDNGKAQVLAAPDFENPVVEGTVKDIVAFFNS